LTPESEKHLEFYQIGADLCVSLLCRTQRQRKKAELSCRNDSKEC
jgi:hypothetical protein